MKPKPLNLEEIEKSAIKELNIRESGAVLKTIDFVRQHIKSACEFFLQFKNDPSVFFALYPQYYDDFEKNYGPLSKNLEDTTLFNEWLFKLAFKDVFKERDKE